MRTFLLLAALMLGHPAHCGGWLREEGAAFLSFSATTAIDGSVEGALFFEYGLRPNLTLGVKIDADMNGATKGEGRAFAFARKAIPTGKRAFVLAYEVGVGVTIGVVAAPLLRTGLGYGRGITLWDKPGWISLDGAVEWDPYGETTTSKLDGTLGLTLTDRLQVMLQLFHSQTGNTRATTLAPSVIWHARPHGKTSYQFGLETTGGDYEVKLGLWRRF